MAKRIYLADEGGNAFRHKREEAGLTVKEASKITHVPIGTIRCWEYGQRVPPDYVADMYFRLLTEKN